MLKSLTIAAVTAGLLLTGCDQGRKAEAPAEAGPMTPAQRNAARAAVVALIAADDQCTPDRLLASDRARVKDLGHGVIAVVAGCSTGMIDVWSRLYLVKADGVPVATPLLVFDNQGDDQWRAEPDLPNLVWSKTGDELEAGIRAQATNCGWDARWRWDGARMALVEMKSIGCDAEHSTDVLRWPTTPATPEPVPAPAES